MTEKNLLKSQLEVSNSKDNSPTQKNKNGNNNITVNNLDWREKYYDEKEEKLILLEKLNKLNEENNDLLKQIEQIESLNFHQEGYVTIKNKDGIYFCSICASKNQYIPLTKRDLKSQQDEFDHYLCANCFNNVKNNNCVPFMQIKIKK